MRLRLVTSNAHKLQEYGRILGGLGCMLPLDQVDADSVVECGATYYQNAYRKAFLGMLSVPAALADNSIILADDSGLELSLFDNMPGVQSARFRHAHLLERAALSAFLSEHRVSTTPARFICWIVAFLPGSRRCVACSGSVSGIVTPESRGSHGFGYDPLFTPDGYSLTFSEMDSRLKDLISHRARAAQALWCALQGALPLRP
ncbi:MAG: non-canonical purine NTP pyrophosphatase [Caldiserica bacterium]|nr:non-canonical purine NTP pyrophosphatase [Caldisericota bacterium]